MVYLCKLNIFENYKLLISEITFYLFVNFALCFICFINYFFCFFSCWTFFCLNILVF